MSLTVRLIPKLGDPHEILRPGLTERCEVVFDSDRDEGEFIVGRGGYTGISDIGVEDEAFRLSFDATCFAEHQVRASLMKESNLYLNGFPWDAFQPHVYLSHGDVVSLDGLRYEYKIHIEARRVAPPLHGSPSSKKPKFESDDAVSIWSGSCESEEQGEPSSQNDISTPSSGIAITHESASRLAEEIQCAVCLDIQVHPRTLHPCGHSFCCSCLQQLKQCPQCRRTIESDVPAVQLDNLICTLVSLPNLLDKGDVDHYFKRKSQQPKTKNHSRESFASKLGTSQNGRSTSDFRRMPFHRSDAIPIDISESYWGRSGATAPYMMFSPAAQALAPRNTPRNRNRAGATQESAINID